MKFRMLDNEYWWGGIVDSGVDMPFSFNSDYVMDLSNVRGALDQSSPLFISSMGRYLWSDSPFTISFKKGTIYCEGSDNIQLCEGYKTLKEANLAALNNHFRFDGLLPNELFFKLPQYNTWIELIHEQTEENILKYAQSIIESKMPKGIIMIDDGWQEDIGTFKFHTGKFKNPKEMIEKLHNMGFKVMLWVIPIVSPDSQMFRDLKEKDFLIKDKNGDIAIREWWGGYSAVFDLTNFKACEWFYNELDTLMKDYGVDGFKFDGGDPYFYKHDDCISMPMNPQEQTRVYNRFALKYQFNEFRASWKCGGEPLVMRLQDKKHSWDNKGINCIIPDSIMQGLMGYAFHCPDMIGGGEAGNSFDLLDEELIVRYAQASALMPMMQFSLAPWRVLSKKNLAIVKETSKLHEKFGDLIISLAFHASKTGEPIIRHMAYEFPDEGFETITDQFMLGNEILVAPVIKKGANTREIKFPKGKWLGEDGSVEYGPCDKKVSAPLTRLPWYKKEY